MFWCTPTTARQVRNTRTRNDCWGNCGTQGLVFLGTQVLQEFCINVRRKAEHPLSTSELRRAIEDYLSWEIVVNDGASVLEALEMEQRFQISFWDALIIQAAESAGAEVLYSNDLSTGQKYGSVQVINPFTNARRTK